MAGRMLYQTSDRWPLERRGPQHAAPFNNSAPLRRHGGRALRLIVTAGAWGAGLCLVIGLVAMVAQGAVPSRSAHARDSPDDLGHVRGAAFAGFIRRFTSGKSLRLPAYFTVAAHSRWELRWAYRCAAGTRGYLTVSEPAASSGVSIRAAGAAGHGLTWAFSDASTHFLMINGNCPWTITVTGRRH